MEEKPAQSVGYSSQEANGHESWFNTNTDTVLLALKYLNCMLEGV